MNEFTLMALSPLDGRYAQKCDALRPIFSEFALFKYRLQVEIAWLVHLSKQDEIKEVTPLDKTDETFLQQLLDNFSIQDALRIKEIENTTRHDVKAVEYFLKEKLQKNPHFKHVIEFVHFACTSEDINNLSYALMVKDAKQQIIAPMVEKINQKLKSMAQHYANQPMLARTHGQSASPTTLGKELANFVARLQNQLQSFSNTAIPGKINGAVGNFNAHAVAYPHADWLKISKDFIEGLDLTWQTFTTQIEPHDHLAEILQHFSRINTVLIDLCRDLWGYISLGYFTQKLVEGEVGSSTMPHKINPIDFENAEGNLGIANALAQHLVEKLPVSRWQRDLSDSTVLRNLGIVFGHGYLSYTAILQGLNKLAANPARLAEDLDNNWEVLAEAIQTVMRCYGIHGAYEQLKTLSRGKKLDRASLHTFIDTQPLPQEVKDQLKQLTPASYIGYATKLVDYLS